MLDLSSFLGESSVYIAFRHHNTDMFVLILMILWTNIVGKGFSNLTSSETQYATSATQLMILVRCYGYSDANLSGYEFHYTIDGTNSTMSGSQT